MNVIPFRRRFGPIKSGRSGERIGSKYKREEEMWSEAHVRGTTRNSAVKDNKEEDEKMLMREDDYFY